MEQYYETEVIENVEGKDVSSTIAKYLSTLRYLDKVIIKVVVDGTSKNGTGTKNSSTYQIIIKYLEDCVTY